MKNKNSKKKFIILIAIIAVAAVLIFIYLNKDEKEKITLTCEGIQTNDKAQFISSFLIEKKGDKTYVNHTGKIDIFKPEDAGAKVFLVYVAANVKKFKENSNLNVTYEVSKTKLEYELGFYMESLSESEINKIIGISSSNVEELKNYFEGRGFVCEEN